MFLAWKEIKFSKTKFGLIISVVVLVSYLVYFLTSLAFGLASSYTNGITAWNADNIVLNANSNNNIMMSTISPTDLTNLTSDGETARLGFFPAVINNFDVGGKKLDVYTFGVDSGSFIAPDTTLNDNEVIVESSLKDEGFTVGDIITIPSTGDNWTIVGFLDNITYQTAPILYVNMNTWQTYRFGSVTHPDLFSAVVAKGSITSSSIDLVVSPFADFISTLPGYTAQVLTFSIMIGFLILIVAFVLGIFIYVLTIQKTSMFGVMKAQGISNAYIGGSVVLQTIIITGIGIAGGLGLTLVSGYFLAGIVPFAINPIFYLTITGLFFLFSVLGGLFSVQAVLKIDPRTAIG